MFSAFIGLFFAKCEAHTSPPSPALAFDEGGPTSRRLILDGKVRTEPAPWNIGLDVGGALCSGTLVSADLVVTAGHCGFPKGEKVYCNLLDRRKAGQDPVSQERTVVSAKKSPDVDLKLFKVEPPFDISDKARCYPAHLPFSPPKVGDKLLVTGWGNYNKNGDASKQLRETKAEIAGVAESLTIKEEHLTQGGDSGAGAIQQKCGKNYIVAANSRSEGTFGVGIFESTCFYYLRNPL